MNPDIQAYNATKTPEYRKICELLMKEICIHLSDAENKVWHAHPVWFLAGNPVVGYSKQKAGIRLMFWSGADFAEPALTPGTGKFKDASIFYTNAEQVDRVKLAKWLEKSRKIQWDYKNIVKRKGIFERLF